MAAPRPAYQAQSARKHTTSHFDDQESENEKKRSMPQEQGAFPGAANPPPEITWKIRRPLAMRSTKVQPATGDRRRKLTWTEPERPKTGTVVHQNRSIVNVADTACNWTRPMTNPISADWGEEKHVLMKFIGVGETAENDDKQGYAMIKMLASRVRSMTFSEREDLYGAMRTLVKLADAPAEEQEVLLNTLANAPTSRRAQRSNSLLLGDESEQGVDTVIQEFQDEEDRLSALLEDPNKKGISFVDGDVSHDRAGTHKEGTNVQVEIPPKRTESWSRYGATAARGGVSDWRRNRDMVDRKRRYCRVYKAIAAFFGTMAACVQHELLVRGFSPQHVLVDICKGLNLLSAVILVALIYRAQHLNEIFERIRLHLRLLLPLNLSVRASIILSKPVFWVESVVCFLHLPPFVTFECGVMNWNNFVLYRAETIFMLWNTLRIYLFWKCFIDAVLERLPRRHTVSSFTGVRMNSAFTFKQVLNSEQAVVVIALFWFGQILLLGYWFRAVEATACLFGVDSGSTAQGDYLEPTAVHPGCQEENSYQWRVWIIDGNFDKVNDMYLWNAMWSMFSSSTSVGFGDVLATTHLGRVVAGLSNVSGIIMIAMLTSSFMLNLHYTPEEESAIQMIEKEKAVRSAATHSARFLQQWFRMQQRRKLGGAGHATVAMRSELHQLKTSFRKCREAAFADYSDMCADRAKIDQLAVRTKYMKEAAVVVQKRTAPDFSPGPQELWEAGNDQIQADPTMSEEGAAPALTDFEDAARREVQRRAGALRRAQEQGFAGRDDESLKQFTRAQQKLKRDASLATLLAAKDNEPKLVAAPGSSFKEIVERARSDARKELEVRFGQRSWYAAVCGLGGTALSIILNELMVRGSDPDAPYMEALKAGGSVLAIATVACIYQIYWVNILHSRLLVHLRRGTPYDAEVTVGDVCWRQGSVWFWLEFIACILHVPPFAGMMEFSSTFMSNVVVYRLETVGCAASMLRVYLAWRPVVYHILKDIPSKHNIAGFAGIEFTSGFVVKWMLNSWHAVLYISTGWLCALVVMSYIYRLAEHMHSCTLEYSQHPACSLEKARVWSLYGRDFTKENDLNVFNSFWFIFTCITPGAGGNVSVATHFGRCVAAAAVIMGVLIGSLTTAALGNLMIFTASEHTARGIMKRESNRLLFMRAAANILALWWRKRRAPHKITKNQKKMDLYGYRRAFLAAERLLKVDLEECASMSAKINQIVKNASEVRGILDEIGVNLMSSSAGLNQRQRMAIAQRS